MKFSDAVLRPPAIDKVFESVIAHPDVYIWDSWALSRKNDPVLYLYALASPRDVYKDGSIDIQTQRDHIPHHHRLFTSNDNGKTWHDGGPVFYPSKDPAAFDSRSVWTGSAVEFGGKIIAGYTGIRQTDEDHPFIQGFNVSVSDDGKNYTRVTPDALSDPIRDYDQIVKAGYYLGPRDDLGTGDGEDGLCILAWRDPGLVVDPQTGLLHAFWSAKSSVRRTQEAVLGHGIIHDPLTKPRLELLPPVYLPDAAEFTQAEVPQLICNRTTGDVYLVVSTTNRITKEQTDGDLDLNARLYISKSMNGPWQSAGRVIERSNGLYPASIVALDENAKGGVLKFIAPYNRSNREEIMHTMPAIRQAVIENGKIIEIIAGD